MPTDPFDYAAADGDPFDLAGQDVPRDGYQRPMILPPPGGWLDGGHEQMRPYTRVSTFCKALDDAYGLMVWRGRHIALAVAKRPDLVDIIAAMNYGSPALDQFIGEALERAKDDVIFDERKAQLHGSLLAANKGTAVHSWAVEHDVPPGVPVPKMVTEQVDAYAKLLADHDFRVVESEIFVVDDVHGVAGTFDDLYDVPVVGDERTYRIGDKKTGGLNPLSFLLQLTAYAYGKRYNPQTGERSPIMPGFDRTIGHLVHLPAGAEPAIYDFDLNTGRELMAIAAQARAVRTAAGLRSLYRLRELHA